MKIESISSNKITNGTQIKTANATYTVLIYGDADGDGEVNVFDARQIVEWLLYEKEQSVSKITRLASNVDNEKEDVLDIFDARRIVEFSLGMNSIIDTMPESDILKDKEAPIITLNGDKEVSIKVFEEYKDLGATVKDNLDETIGDKIVVDTSKVNINVPGDYEVTYNAVDASGNKAETVKRIVHVEDYVTDIEIGRYPKLQYVVGQEITIDNMIAYEVLAYGGKVDKPIDVKDIKYTPTKATEDMIGTAEIVFEYKGVKKRITIEVQERVPIITLTGHNGSTDVKIRLGEEYVEGATAFDEIDQKQLQVFISGTVDKNTEGKYTITYTSEPNSLGKVGKVIRTVEVCDYVTDVNFEVDDSKFKKDYIEGQTISLEGISAILTKASGKTETTTNGLKVSEEKAVYDRKTENNNIDRELEVTYTAVDPVDGTSKVYKSTDKLSDIRINVKKQFETVNVIGSAVEEGIVYEDTLVATVEEGANEDSIRLDNLDIKVTPTEKDEHGCETKAWIEESKTEPGAVDVYFRGIKNNTKYTITLTPKTDSKYKKSKTFTFTTTGSEEINSVKIDSIKTSKGEALEEFNKDGKTVNGFKVGDSIVVDLSFYHNYKYNNKNHEVELSNVAKDKISAKVINKPTTADPNAETEVEGITTRIIEKEGKISLEITAKDNAPSFDTGTEIVIKATATNDPLDATKNHSVMGTTYIFAKSRYTVRLNEESKNDITLSLKDIKTNNGYEMKKFGNDVYTLLPLSIQDQYNKEKKMTIDDISTDYTDIQNGKLVFYDGITQVPDRNYIKTIKLKSKTEEAKAGEQVRFVGIAIRDLPEIASEEDLLETKTMAVYFEGTKVREYNPIKIVRNDISNLEYTIDTNSNPVAGTVECYEDITIGKVMSGARQEALTASDLSRIGVIVKKGNETSEKLIGKPTGSKPNEVECISKNKDFGANILFNGNGNVTISFWAKNEGTGDNRYLITPYIEIGEGSSKKEVAMDAGKYVTVNENKTVNKVKFTDENGVELEEGKFGTVDFGPRVEKTLKVNFYHEYEKAVDKIGEEDNRLITNVKRSEVKAPKAIDTNNQIEKTQIVIDNGTYTDDVTDNSTLSDSIKDKYVTKISVALKENPDTTGIVKFSVIVNDETFDFTGTIGKRLEVDNVEFGTEAQNTNGIKIYTKSEADSAELRAKLVSKEVVKDNYGIYYTVVPITFKSGTREIGSNIKASGITTNIQNATIYLEDNLKDSDLGIVVQAIGLDEDKKQVSGDKDIYYIGIGVMSDYHEYVFGGNTDLGPLSLDNCSIKCKFEYTNQAGNTVTFDETFDFDITSDYND